jgi:serine/threonine protein kinase
MADRFEIRGEVSRDEVSVLYEARDRTLARDVVLKRLLPQARRDSRLTARLVREAGALAQVRSPRVLSMYEVGEDEEGPYLCIEPARGPARNKVRAR